MVTPADYNDNIHAALEAVINGAGDGHLHLPGRYVIDRPLVAAKLVDGVYKQVSVKITGNERFCSPGKTGVFATFKDYPILSIQRGKGCEVMGLNISGAYKAPVMDEQALYNSDFATYGDPTCTDTRNRIYAGIGIDPEQGSDRGGSTGVMVRDCAFDNVTAGVAVSINGRTQNAELLTFENIVIGTCKVGFVFGQAQEKMNRIINVKAWETVRRLFDWNHYGECTAGHYSISSVNTAGNCVELLHRDSRGAFPLHMTDIYCERLGNIGHWNTSLSDTLNLASINFNKNIIPDAHLTGNGLTINNSDIRYYGLDRKVLLQHRDIVLNNVKGQFVTGWYGKKIGLPVMTTDGKIITPGTGKVGSSVVFAGGSNNGLIGTGVIESVTDGMMTVRVSKSIKADQNYYIQ